MGLNIWYVYIWWPFTLIWRVMRWHLKEPPLHMLRPCYLPYVIPALWTIWAWEWDYNLSRLPSSQWTSIFISWMKYSITWYLVFERKTPNVHHVWHVIGQLFRESKHRRSHAQDLGLQIPMRQERCYIRCVLLVSKG